MINQRYFSLFAFILIIGWLFWANYAYAGSISLDIRGESINLKAEGASLDQILSAIASKTGLSLKTGNPLTESISHQCLEIPVTDCIQQLLGKRNYVMIYSDQGNGKFPLSELWLDGAENQGWFEREFGDEKALLKEFRAKQVISSESMDPTRNGIQITNLSSNSSFRKLGIKEGDLITNVNGVPINSAESFVQALKPVFKDQTSIRIERRTNNGMIDPVYVPLR